MKAGPYKTKKDAVEAGLKLLARQVAYREILKWRGKLKWEGDESIDWTVPDASSPASVLVAREPAPPPFGGSGGSGGSARNPVAKPQVQAKLNPVVKRRAGR